MAYGLALIGVGELMFPLKSITNVNQLTHQKINKKIKDKDFLHNINEFDIVLTGLVVNLHLLFILRITDLKIFFFSKFLFRMQ